MAKDVKNDKEKGNGRIIPPSPREDFVRKTPNNTHDGAKGDTETTNSTGPRKTNDKQS